MPLTSTQLRRRAIAASLFPPTALADAVARLGFVQADPIRAPARAQDLILRHRVARYRAGDLERHYPRLDLDEDFVYAYGFVPAATRRLLHPRGPHELGPLAHDVLGFVRDRGPAHPRDVAEALGLGRERNAWGGTSRSTTRALEALHYRGLVRVARRDAGVRVYAAVPPSAEPPLPPDERLQRLVLVVSALLGPLPEASLRALLPYLRRAVPDTLHHRTTIAALLRTGALASDLHDGVRYLWRVPDGAAGSVAEPDPPAPRRVRFLAPFDPLVWDRRRVEQLWGWAYRFEAYTPAARRQLGYYALPVLWGERLVGWANVAVSGGTLDVALGFVTRRPAERAFERGVEAEVGRMEAFLRVGEMGNGKSEMGS